ncbi:hypothetical protein FISHEDRAFT_19313, partial [Fistulina hepatica ATCC 64428]
LLLDDNDDVVDTETWEETEHGRLRRASTYWIEQKDAHGLEHFEPARNVEILEVPSSDDVRSEYIAIRVLSTLIHGPFHTMDDLLSADHPSSDLLANVTAAPSTPLYTALVFLASPVLSAFEQTVVDCLAPLIPTIVLPRRPSARYATSPTLSSIVPASPAALQTLLFHTPPALSTLRSEAAQRFLHWREHCDRPWDKVKWEAHWRCASEAAADKPQLLPQSRSVNRCVQPLIVFDPLHLPSLLVFLVSMLGPLRDRLARSVRAFSGPLTIIGSFCIGFGLGHIV